MDVEVPTIYDDCRFVPALLLIPSELSERTPEQDAEFDAKLIAALTAPIPREES